MNEQECAQWTVARPKDSIDGAIKDHEVLLIKNCGEEIVYLGGDEKTGIQLDPFETFAYCKTCAGGKELTLMGRSNIRVMETIISNCGSFLFEPESEYYGDDD